jgi:hypothetical protein
MQTRLFGICGPLDYSVGLRRCGVRMGHIREGCELRPRFAVSDRGLLCIAFSWSSRPAVAHPWTGTPRPRATGRTIAAIAYTPSHGPRCRAIVRSLRPPRESPCIPLRLKGPEVVSLVRLNLDTGKLRGRIRRDDSGVIAEFEEPFHALLVVRLRKRGFKRPLRPACRQMGKGNSVRMEHALGFTESLEPIQGQLMLIERVFGEILAPFAVQEKRNRLRNGLRSAGR